MPDCDSPDVRIAADLPYVLASAKSLSIPELVVQAFPLRSVGEYSLSQHGKNFPRPSEHFVIADYLIDLSIIAVDLGAGSSTFGRVIGYAYGDYWLIGNSLADFLERLKTEKADAVWGKPL